MRKLEAMAAIILGRFGAHSTRVSPMFVVPAKPRRRARLTQNARLTQHHARHLLLRQSQVLDSKGH
jgi:hypothetical protein